MFSHVDSFEPEEFADIIKKVIFSIVMDQEIQIAIYLVVAFFVAFFWIQRQISTNSLSGKSAAFTLLSLLFVMSVVNNHNTLLQVNLQFSIKYFSFTCKLHSILHRKIRYLKTRN